MLHPGSACADLAANCQSPARRFERHHGFDSSIISKAPKANFWPAPQRDFRTVRSTLGRAGGYDPTLPDRSKPRQLLRKWLDGDKTRVAVESFAASCEATWPNGSRIAQWLRPRYVTVLLVRCTICYRRPGLQGGDDWRSISNSSSGEHPTCQLRLSRQAGAQRGKH